MTSKTFEIYFDIFILKKILEERLKNIELKK